MIKFMQFNGILHRDLKPENILLFDDNIIKISDFGWSICDKSLSLEGSLNNNQRKTFCGTDDYLAPELAKNEYYDEYIDIWTIGILTFELLFGCTPFNINNINDSIYVREQIKNNKMVDLDVCNIISESCKDFIKMILINDVESRPGLDQILNHQFLIENNNEYGAISSFWNNFWYC